MSNFSAKHYRLVADEIKYASFSAVSKHAIMKFMSGVFAKDSGRFRPEMFETAALGHSDQPAGSYDDIARMVDGVPPAGNDGPVEFKGGAK